MLDTDRFLCLFLDTGDDINEDGYRTVLRGDDTNMPSLYDETGVLGTISDDLASINSA